MLRSNVGNESLLLYQIREGRLPTSTLLLHTRSQALAPVIIVVIWPPMHEVWPPRRAFVLANDLPQHSGSHTAVVDNVHAGDEKHAETYRDPARASTPKIRLTMWLWVGKAVALRHHTSPYTLWDSVSQRPLGGACCASGTVYTQSSEPHGSGSPLLLWRLPRTRVLTKVGPWLLVFDMHLCDLVPFHTQPAAATGCKRL